MISAKIEKGNLSKYFTKVRKDIEDSVDKQFKRKVLVIFRDLVIHSPQWSGDFASNWNISHDRAGKGYSEYPLKGHTLPSAAKSMGDSGATRAPLARANAVRFGYKDAVYFTNNAPVKFDGRSKTVTGDAQPWRGARLPMTVKIRPVNLLDGRLALISYIRSRYGK